MVSRQVLSRVFLSGVLFVAVTGAVYANGSKVTLVAPKAFALSQPMGTLAQGTAAPLTGATQSFTRTGTTVNYLNFAGTPDVNYAYPDSNGAPGATQYMQWTNARYEVFSKTTGAKILGPVSAKLLWANLGGPCATTNSGDGIVNYDKAAGRWIITHHTGAGTPYLQCVGVSTTSDATGSYFLYAFSLTSQYYPDYPQLGVWPDAYYLSVNLLTVSGFYNVGAQVCALDRNNMLIGNPNATAQCLQIVTPANYSVLQPADLDGATPPPSGAPNYLMALDNNALDLYKFHVDWVTPSNSTLSGPQVIAVQPFTQACGGGYCIPQLGTGQTLDGVGDRLLHRLAYRNFGTYDVMVINHSVVAGSSVGVRWYEIRNPGNTPTVYQQGTLAPDSNYRWLGSAGMDKLGNIAMGYSVSSLTMYPAIRYSVRRPFDPLGTLDAEVSVFAGTGSQTASGNDWGNASSLSIDPMDDCTFWYTNEYLKTTGTLWATRINTFTLGACTP